VRDEEKILRILGELSDHEKLIMKELARIEKTDSNIFHEDHVKRKGSVVKKKVNVADVLRSLERKDLLLSKGKKKWQTTSIGRKVEHRLYDEFTQKEYGFSVVPHT
jgi:hypothetical protein